MGQALYRKYRSKRLDEVLGQEHITDTLKRALQQGRISHAYLFSGPRGVGKTSIARILAHEINDIPYTDDSDHLDIIEIDAASNRRIDEIRELRDKVYIAPTSGKYKVYIIDEVHMLTREAFNALLKTLEEPPAHAVFILATTESHKLPETIISRTQHFTFRPVEESQVVAHLKHIAKQEGVKLDDEALALLAAHGGGSFRDSISLLDQARSIGSSVTAQDVQQLLGIAPESALLGLISLLGQPDAGKAIMEALSDMYNQGLRAPNIASQLSALLRTSLTGSTPALPLQQLLPLMKSLLEVPAGHSPERLLEIHLLQSNQLINRGSESTPVVPTSSFSQSALHAVASPVVTVSPIAPTASHAHNAAATSSTVTSPVTPQPGTSVERNTSTASKATATDPGKSNATSAQPEEPKADQTQTPPKPASTDALATAIVQGPAVVVPLSAAVWPDILQGIKKDYNTIYGVLRMANPVFTDTGVEIQCKFAFHQKRLNEVKYKQIIAEYIKRVTGSDVEIVCSYIKPDAAGAGQPAPALEAISNIFGGGEVL